MLAYERMRKYEGTWHLEKANLFPGCVVLECEGDQELLKVLQALHQELPMDDFNNEKNVVAVNEAEESCLREMVGEMKYLPMSKGVIRSGRIRVTEGPLRGREQMISKVDRHKRIAFLKFQDGPADSCLKAGLEITEKTV